MPKATIPSTKNSVGMIIHSKIRVQIILAVYFNERCVYYQARPIQITPPNLCHPYR